MTNRTYTPILRWKRGEKICLRELPSSMKTKIWPCLALRDPGGRRYVGDTTRFLADLDKEIGATPCYLNFPALDQPMSPRDILADLKSVIGLSAKHLTAVPACDVPSLAIVQALSNSVKNAPASLALRIRPSFDLDDVDQLIKLAPALTKRGTNSLHLLVDRETDGAHDSNDLQSGLTKLLKSGRFARVALIAGTMPLGIQIGSHKFERPDFLAYLKLINDEALQRLCFGDYGILSPDWREPSGGGGTVPTVYRYTTNNRWLVFKDRNNQGPTVAKLVTLNSAYRGPDYSPGDKAIFDRSRWTSGVGRGGAEQFLRDSASQHIVFVANQLA